MRDMKSHYLSWITDCVALTFRDGFFSEHVNLTVLLKMGSEGARP